MPAGPVQRVERGEEGTGVLAGELPAGGRLPAHKVSTYLHMRFFKKGVLTCSLGSNRGGQRGIITKKVQGHARSDGTPEQK